jgi:DNA invertase Pin-like site-specific DNA recombinase
MTVYGYLRVSTAKQEENNYKNSILQLANDKKLGNVLWIQETVSGRKDWKNRLLGKEFEKMKKGDIIIMGEYSRIGRDFLSSMSFLADCQRKGVTVYSTMGDIPINNDSTSNLLLAVTAWKAQIERENISYRTKIGLASHKANGSVLGRPRKMVLEKDINNIRLIKEEIEKGVKMKKICEHFNITTPTLNKFIKKHNLKDIGNNKKII